MKVTPIKTDIVKPFALDIEDVLSGALAGIPENSILAITSKIVALCEGNVAVPEETDRDELIRHEADLFLPKAGNPYNVYLTIKNNALIPNAGVDESNANGYYVLWPRDPRASAERCRRFVMECYRLSSFGVIITDSTVTPLKMGVTGICIAHCGFKAVNDHIGRSDLFGRPQRMTRINAADALAAAAVLCMGETDEQTPLALLEDLPFIRFTSGLETERQPDETRIDPAADLFGQLLACAPWVSGK